MRNMTEEERLKIEVLQRNAALQQSRFNLLLVEIRNKYCKLNPRDDELAQEELEHLTEMRLNADRAKAEQELAFLELQEACRVPVWARPGTDGAWKNPDTGKSLVVEVRNDG